MGQTTNDKSKDVQNLKSKTSSNDDEKQNKDNKPSKSYNGHWNLITSIIIAIIGFFVTIGTTQIQINNSQKENRENNIFQVATKIDLSRVNLIVKNEKYSSGNLLLSPEKKPNPNNKMICIENSGSSTAYNISICVNYNRLLHVPTNSTKKWYYLQALSPGQKIYIDEDETDLSNVHLQCSSSLGETLDLKYHYPDDLTVPQSSFINTTQVYYDKAKYVNDLKKLDNTPSNSPTCIREYPHNFKSLQATDDKPQLNAFNSLN
ncbi:hypothetical protein [Ligilactobacillus aviarius]|uniref:hypothetical protein n=1 Tax=Ligilactobacillus aviarius TaxID=1606 RepID=UPI0024B8FFAB|nr:hypothetical protein [Ligilactobacillus aviarius]